MTFEELRAECLSCTRCSLCKTRTNVVFGDGCANADVMIIGEGPGKNEDEQGVPFIGRSGQLLDKMMAQVGLSRDKNVFIANIVKCRPPENRNPLAKEWAACMPYLHEQIKIVEPKIVLCLGRIAAQQFIKKDFSVMREHGEWKIENGIHITATLHPAAILRSPSLKPLAEADFMRVASLLGALK